ncbi:hypothetical protein [Neolewinella persica]|uniref:hypothetical protein n=1 Tax=Neolewinella persica TaxID=70998 RepID=UPI0003642A83|nr:hypothetical protein [Neolewinella persica]
MKKSGLLRLARIAAALVFYLLPIGPANSLSGQSLFDLAVELDSLYDRLEEADATAAEPFFAALRKAGKLAPDVSAVDIKQSLLENELLHPKVELAFNQLKLFNDIKQDSIEALESKQDTLIIKAIQSIKSCMCPDSSLGEDFRQAIAIRGIPFRNGIEILILLIEDEKSPMKDAELKRKLRQVQGQYNLIAIRLRWLKSADSTQFVTGEEALDFLRGVAGKNDGINYPIIINNQSGGLGQSAIIDGAAKWIADRLRQELSIAFFDRFERWAETQNLSMLFPNTLAVLKSSATTDYSLMMDVYKGAFTKDLDHLTFNVPGFLEKELLNTQRSSELVEDIAKKQLWIDSLVFFQGQDKAYIGTLHSLIGSNSNSSNAKDKRLRRSAYSSMDWSKRWIVDVEGPKGRLEQHIEDHKRYLHKENMVRYLKFSLQAVNQLRDGEHPATLLKSLYTSADELFPNNQNLEAIILLLSEISESLIATDLNHNTAWRGKKAINHLSSDIQFRNIFFGLLGFRIDNILQREVQNSTDQINLMAYQSDQDSLTNMIKAEQAGFNEFYNFAWNAFGRGINNGWNTFSFWDDTLGDYYSFSLVGSRKEINQNYGVLLQAMMLDRKLKEYCKRRALLIDNTRAGINRIERIDSLYQVSTTNTDGSRDLTYMLRQNANLDDFFVRGNVGLSYITYDWEKGRSFDSIRKQYFIDFSQAIYSLTNTLNPEKELEIVRTEVDSIIANLLKEQSDLHEYVRDNKISPQGFKQKYRKFYYQNTIRVDSLRLVHALAAKDKVFLRLNHRQHSLKEQQDFLQNLILSPEQQPRFSRLFSKFVQYTDKIDRINTQLKELRAPGKGGVGNEEFIYLIKNSLDILDLIFEQIVDGDNEHLEGIRFATDNLLDAYIEGLNENYHGVVMNIIPVVQRMVEDKYDKLISPLENAARATLTEEQIRLGILPRSDELDSLRLLRDDKLRKMNEIFKYCTFVAAIAESKDSDQVKKAINAIALPVGSYSIKRRAYRNISLNAYPGITGGLERVKNGDVSEWAPNVGFTAPIGIGINWGYRGKKNQDKYLRSERYRNRWKKAEMGIDGRAFTGHSGSVFFSIFDIGALVLFRLEDATESLPQDVKFRQVLSPGVSYVHGFRDVPISLMTGVQLTPGLRTVGEDDKANSLRLNLSLVVDLPIANFHTRRRPRQGGRN